MGNPKPKVPLSIITITISVLAFLALLYTERISSTSFSSSSIFRFKPCAKRNAAKKYVKDKRDLNVSALDYAADDRFEFDPEECSLVNGKWVFNSSIKPLYTDRTCPYLDRQVSCVKNGKMDLDYQKWEWMPDDCILPRFDPIKALQKIQGKRVMFVGDSLQRGQWQSFEGNPVSWMSFLLLLCTGAGLVYYYDREKRRHIEGISNASNAVKQGPSVGKAAIGGPFRLIDHNGKSVSDKDFIGKWNLVYFGFTHCPDICPDELQKMAEAIDKIKEKSGMEVVPVFISVDPERDTVEQVREYVKEFHPKLIGLTGSPDEVKNAARAYRVYYMKTEEEGSDYLVDHSIVMYLMDPNMQFVKFFGKNYDATSLADGVIQEIKQHKKVKA
ncbi:hypothetical protein DH2020_040287 [Rehmannia glutinosa]|uniref:Thioredoxin domain-containing protein n=1 Tax=Rehmannia glutinosa TaxID=99300 RepID=A0ABR0UTF3_REHGL